jgi:hypothetical protein
MKVLIEANSKLLSQESQKGKLVVNINTWGWVQIPAESHLEQNSSKYHF